MRHLYFSLQNSHTQYHLTSQPLHKKHKNWLQTYCPMLVVCKIKNTERQAWNNLSDCTSIKFLKCFLNFQIGSPAYEVSAPVPSHLAYSANIAYQQPIQYRPQFLNEVPNSKPTTIRLFPQPVQPHLIYQPQPSPPFSQVLVPKFYRSQPQYNNVGLQQPVTYFQQNVDQQPHIVPGIVYTQQSEIQQAPTLREFKNSPAPTPPNIERKPVTPPTPAQVPKYHFLLSFSYSYSVSIES